MEYHGYKSLESIKKNINEPFVTMAIIVAYSAGEFKAWDLIGHIARTIH
jgi:hypothetical protein